MYPALLACQFLRIAPPAFTQKKIYRDNTGICNPKNVGRSKVTHRPTGKRSFGSKQETMAEEVQKEFDKSFESAFSKDWKESYLAEVDEKRMPFFGGVLGRLRKEKHPLMPFLFSWLRSAFWLLNVRESEMAFRALFDQHAQLETRCELLKLDHFLSATPFELKFRCKKEQLPKVWALQKEHYLKVGMEEDENDQEMLNLEVSQGDMTLLEWLDEPLMRNMELRGFKFVLETGFGWSKLRSGLVYPPVSAKMMVACDKRAKAIATKTETLGETPRE